MKQENIFIFSSNMTFPQSNIRFRFILITLLFAFCAILNNNNVTLIGIAIFIFSENALLGIYSFIKLNRICKSFINSEIEKTNGDLDYLKMYTRLPLSKNYYLIRYSYWGSIGNITVLNLTDQNGIKTNFKFKLIKIILYLYIIFAKYIYPILVLICYLIIYNSYRSYNIKTITIIFILSLFVSYILFDIIARKFKLKIFFS